jgi:transposase
MPGFLLPEQRQELLSELRKEDKRKYADRFRVILLLDEGRTYKSIAEYLFLDEGSIANYRRRYKEGGIMALIIDDYGGRRCQLSDKELTKLSQILRQHLCLSASEVVDIIKKKFDVDYSLSGATNLLHRLGFSYKKAKAIPGKAKKEEQELFILEYHRLKQEGKIYFVDSTHPEHNPVISYGWIKKGEDFEVLTHNSFRYRLNINGAVDIDSLEVITRQSDRVNSSSICQLLHAIRAKNPSGELIQLIMDNAAYNRSSRVKELAAELGIALIYLPPYSPNLNPIERLWKFFKKKVLYNKYYETRSEFECACTNFFRYIRKYRNELSTLLTDEFHVLGT